MTKAQREHVLKSINLEETRKKTLKDREARLLRLRSNKKRWMERNQAIPLIGR